MKFFLIITLLLTFISCKSKDTVKISSETTSTIDFSKNIPNCYQEDVSNPIIQSGDLFAGSTWNDPSVIYDGGQYIMYASSDLSFDGDIKIYRLVSSDGLNWSRNPATAVLEKGAATQWDDKSVETPSVVIFNGSYHMFYTGYKTNTPTEFEIGHATSPDGITWTKSGSNPILTSVGGGAVPDDFDQFIVAEPGAIVFNNTLHVYFTAQGYITTADSTTVNDQLMTIGLVTSIDGSTFSVPQRVLDPNQTLFPRGSNWKGYSTPAAAIIDGKVHLYVDVMYTSGTDTQRKLFHTSSSDGITSWTNDSSDIHDRSDFSWTSDEIRAPSVLYKDGMIKMWYAGHSGVTLGIGISSCSLIQ